MSVRFRAEAPPPAELAASHDLVVAADGANSGVRKAAEAAFGPDLEIRRCKYMWLGTDLVFDAFKFFIESTPHGVMQIHGYPYDATGSTFIVEMHDAVWQAAGFGRLAPPQLPPGASDEASIDRIRELFASVLGGHRFTLTTRSGSALARCAARTGGNGNVILLGDAAHTAHFSIGSGTKLAMEDALALAACLHEQPGLDEALAAYEAERRPVVASTQRAAQASLEWFENLGQYTGQEPEQFAFNIMTRSRRVTHGNLRVRDPEFAGRIDAWFAGHEKRRGMGGGDVVPPMFQPFRLRALELKNRIVVSAMDMYSARRRSPVRLPPGAPGRQGARRRRAGHDRDGVREPGGADHPGLRGHVRARARGGLAPGHRLRARPVHRQGRPAARPFRPQGLDQADVGGHRRAAARRQLGAQRPVPAALPARGQPGARELTVAEMEEIKQEFVAATRAAQRCGFDLIELHCAHGYLLSSFISPVTNQRTDGYGGSLAGRLRYPLEVFAAMRAAWPAEKPMTVRISATDWYPGGITGEDAIEIARAFHEAGADAIDVSTGQVTPEEAPAFGRSYQTPFADAIRNRLGIATIAVGVISSYDDVNSLILAGRADLCALGRAHLYDPNWTLHAAAEQGYDGPAAAWPDPWKAGSRPPQTGRTDGPRPRLQLIREGDPGTRHARWRC